MTIETKYQVYDKIFFLENNKICNSIIRGVKIEINGLAKLEVNTEIIYLCNEEIDARVHIKVGEKNAFKTKEDLLKSL